MGELEGKEKQSKRDRYAHGAENELPCLEHDQVRSSTRGARTEDDHSLGTQLVRCRSQTTPAQVTSSIAVWIDLTSQAAP